MTKMPITSRGAVRLYNKAAHIGDGTYHCRFRHLLRGVEDFFIDGPYFNFSLFPRPWRDNTKQAQKIEIRTIRKAAKYLNEIADGLEQSIGG